MCRVSPFSLKQQWILPGVLSRLQVGLYHSPYTLMPLFPRVPTVVTVHDLIPLLFPEQSSRKARTFFRGALFCALRYGGQGSDRVRVDAQGFIEYDVRTQR